MYGGQMIYLLEKVRYFLQCVVPTGLSALKCYTAISWIVFKKSLDRRSVNGPLGDLGAEYDWHQHEFYSY